MKKRKKRACDRISELPDSLIFNIFWFLTATDVVRTAILSKRWKNLWTTAPCLYFYDEKKMNTDKFRNLVDGAVNSWRGVKIVRFHVEFDHVLERSLTSDIDLWMQFAVEKKVERLNLSLPYRFNDSDQELYLVPQYLYSCSWLKSLSLRSCDLQIHGNVQWDQLETLELAGDGLSENAINQVLRGSPRLEELFLSICDSKEDLSIRSTSLKRLYIYKYVFYLEDAPSMDTELRICTPNLEALDILGVPYSKCLLMNVSSLTRAWIEFYGPEIYWRDAFPGYGFIGETLSQILPKIKHVQSVTLSSWCIKALGAVKEKCMFSSFPNVKILELKVCSEEYEQLVGILEMFPKLRNLFIKTTYDNLPKPAENFGKNFPYSFLLHLRTVDVTWSDGDTFIFPLIQVLLKYARNLEKMVFSRDKSSKSRTPWKSLFLASQKLLKMKRSSRSAELIFC